METRTRVTGNGSLTANHVGTNTSHREGYKMESAIRWFLGQFNVNLIDAVTAFKDRRVMCPVTVWWLRPTWATAEALRIFPFLDNDATIGGLFRQLPQYIAATQDVVIECEGEKVEWCRVFQEVLPNWSSCCRLLWLFVDVRILSHSSQTSFHSVMGRRNQNLKTRRKLRSEANSKKFGLSHSVTNKEYIGQKYWVYGR